MDDREKFRPDLRTKRNLSPVVSDRTHPLQPPPRELSRTGRQLSKRFAPRAWREQSGRVDGGSGSTRTKTLGPETGHLRPVLRRSSFVYLHTQPRGARGGGDPSRRSRPSEPRARGTGRRLPTRGTSLRPGLSWSPRLRQSGTLVGRRAVWFFSTRVETHGPRV